MLKLFYPFIYLCFEGKILKKLHLFYILQKIKIIQYNNNNTTTHTKKRYNITIYNKYHYIYYNNNIIHIHINNTLKTKKCNIIL